MNVRCDEATQTGALCAPCEGTLDPEIIASMALNDCPAWAQDIIADVPDEATSSSTQLDTPARSPRERPPVVSECPLHTAMRNLTEAAVAQHIFYLEGEVRARPDLVTAIGRWERMHTLIRECICPATREVSVGAASLTEIVDTALEGMFSPGQQHLRTQFVQALEVCSACASTAECPLLAAPGEK